MGNKWDIYRLDEIGKIVTGKTPPSKVENAFTVNGVPFITPRDMDGRRWISKTERHLSSNGLEAVKNSLVPAGTIAVSCIGSDMGKTVLLRYDSVTNQQINSLIVDTDRFNPLYIYYILSTKQDLLKSIASGSATPILNKTHFGQFEIVIPDKGIQDWIVSNLDPADLKVELNRQTNQTLEKMAQTLFKSWFVDFDPVFDNLLAKIDFDLTKLSSDFPAVLLKRAQKRLLALNANKDSNETSTTGINNKVHLQAGIQTNADNIHQHFPCEFEYNEQLGWIPKGWAVCSLGEKVVVKRGGSPRPIKDFIATEGLPWTKISDATASQSRYIKKTKEHIKPEGLNKTTLLKKGSLILSNSATPGLPKFLDLDACVHDGWLHFPKKETFSDLYLYELFLVVRKELVQQGNGSVFTNLKTDILKNHIVIVPSSEILNSFDEYMKGLVEKIHAVSESTSTLQNLRDTLLPKLISGELQIPDGANLNSEEK